MQKINSQKLQFIVPYGRKPVGGIRVIFDLADQLRRSGFNTSVYQFGRGNFVNGSGYDEFLACSKIDKNSHLIIPEILLSRIDPEILAGRPYSTIVQNPYIIFNLKRFSSDFACQNLLNAQNVFAISKDSARIVSQLGYNKNLRRIKWSLDEKFIEASESIVTNKSSGIVTYMPRKCQFQIPTLKFLLIEKAKKFNFEIKPISGVHFSELVSMLVDSKVFVSLCEFEGFAAPPVEAAAVGNIVVGYHGNGNRELFTNTNFVGIESGDVGALVDAVVENIINYADIYNDSARFDLVNKFRKDVVTSFNCASFIGLDFLPTNLDNTHLRIPDSRSTILIDRILTKYNQLLP